MDPSPPNWNVTLPPATTGTGAVTPPENTSCPALSTSPSAASWLASHATDAAGWPITAAPAATDVIFGAVDVLDSRYEGFKFTLTDVVADNASAGGFYLGPVTRKPSEIEDLRLIGCVVRVGGEVIMTAASAAVMGHPAASVAWLANQLAAQGEGLKAGQLIFSGGVTAPVPVAAGGSVTFEFAGLGSIEVAGE